MSKLYFSLFLICYYLTHLCLAGKDSKNKETKPEEKWKKKDVTDYSDADVERLFDQWEVQINSCFEN